MIVATIKITNAIPKWLLSFQLLGHEGSHASASASRFTLATTPMASASTLKRNHDVPSVFIQEPTKHGVFQNGCFIRFQNNNQNWGGTCRLLPPPKTPLRRTNRAPATQIIAL